MLAIAWLACANVASALVLDSGDGGGNTERPVDDPGWDNVGRRLGGPTVIYLGNGWVISAHHVGVGIVVFGETRYDPVPDTSLRLTAPGGMPSDLMLFRIADKPALPELPPLPIARRTPPPGSGVVLIGFGRARGAALTVRGSGGELLDGFAWDPDSRKRWGTNLVAGPAFAVEHEAGRTLAFATRFSRIDDPDGTPYEAQAAEGDSGGAVFAPREPFDPSRGWALAGVIFSVSQGEDQPQKTSLYGAETYSADLASYREQILLRVRPACSNEHDDDGDGRIDFPADRGCDDPLDGDELGGDVVDRPGWIAAAAALCAVGVLFSSLTLLRGRSHHRDR